MRSILCASILISGLALTVLHCAQSDESLCQSAADHVAACTSGQSLAVTSCDALRAEEILQKDCSEINTSSSSSKGDWASDWAMACHLCGATSEWKYCRICFQVPSDSGPVKLDAAVGDAQRESASMDLGLVDGDQGSVPLHDTAKLDAVLSDTSSDSTHDTATVDECYLSGIDEYGCCTGQILKYCENKKVVSENCGPQPICGWNFDTELYSCGTDGNSDPNGYFPKTCP